MKPLRLIVIIALLLILFIPLTGCEAVTGSGKLASWEMAYTDFTRLAISNGFDIQVTRGDDYNVSITIDEVLYEYLEISQGGDTVRIGLKGGRTYTGTTQQAVVTMPDLRRLELSGASTGKVAGFDNVESIRFDASGGSGITLEACEGDTIEVNLSSESRAMGSLVCNEARFSGSSSSVTRVTGTAQHLSINGSGGSRFLLQDFSGVTGAIKLGSGSYGTIDVSERIELELSGSSELEYQGEPRIGSINVSSGSIITQR